MILDLRNDLFQAKLLTTSKKILITECNQTQMPRAKSLRQTAEFFFAAAD